MKANQFFNKILDKWPVKVCCLVIAIAMYLFHQASLTEKRSFVIPLTVLEEGSVVHTGDYTSTVTVSVRANTEQISSVHSNDLNAYVNLNDIAKNGEYNLPVMVKVADELLACDPFEVKVKPEYIKLKVESKDLKFIPLTASVVGEPEHGYEITSVKVSPSELEVYGPSSILENIDKIYTDKVDVTGLTQKETFNVNYKTVNKYISVTEKGPYEVVVTVEPSHMEKLVENVEVNVTLPPENLYLKDDIAPLSIKLEGTVPVLETYEPGKRFVTLDLSKINEPGEYDLPLTFNVPSYLKMVEASQDTVHLEILAVEEDTGLETEGDMEVSE